MKHLIIFSILAIFIYNQLDKSWSKVSKQSQAVTSTKELRFLPERFEKLAVGKNVYYASSNRAGALRDYSSLGIKTIVRLNGGGKDAGHLGIKEEAAFAEKAGIRLYYYNIDGGDEIEQAVRHLSDGNTVVHCKHGAHRAPLVAGCFMLSQGASYEATIKAIKWEKIQHNPKYQKYVNSLKSWAKQYASTAQLSSLK